MSCVICMEENEECICCSNCRTEVCKECMDDFLSFCKNNKTIPLCPNTKSKSEYFYEEIKSFDRELLEDFADIYLNYIKTHPTLTVQSEMEETIKNMLTTLTENKRKIIKDKYPVAINLVIEIALQKKFKENSASSIKNIKKLISKKKCINYFCKKGFLIEKDDFYICSSCDDKFCNKCEVKISKLGDHECKNEDLNSFSLKDKIVKCPNCDVHIERSGGCDNMTCQICKTNFNYITGTITSLGSENKPFEYKGNQKSILNNMKNLNEDIVSFIYEFESKIPKKPKVKSVIKYIEKNDPRKLYKEYSKYKKSLIEYRIYYEKLEIIEKLYDTNTLTMEKLFEL